MSVEKGDDFTIESKIQNLEANFKEIDKLLFNHDLKPASKKPLDHKEPGKGII